MRGYNFKILPPHNDFTEIMQAVGRQCGCGLDYGVTEWLCDGDSIAYIRGTCDGKSGTVGAIDLIRKGVQVIIGPACGHGINDLIYTA